jgi:hypothetical protein
MHHHHHHPIHIKKSAVKPIYKKGMKEDANNYRPITRPSPFTDSGKIANS